MSLDIHIRSHLVKNVNHPKQSLVVLLITASGRWYWWVLRYLLRLGSRRVLRYLLRLGSSIRDIRLLRRLLRRLLLLLLLLLPIPVLLLLLRRRLLCLCGCCRIVTATAGSGRGSSGWRLVRLLPLWLLTVVLRWWRAEASSVTAKRLGWRRREVASERWWLRWCKTRRRTVTVVVLYRRVRRWRWHHRSSGRWGRFAHQLVHFAVNLPVR